MSATPNINLLKIKGNKFDATSAPSATDDSSAGYQVGSVWIDVTNDKAYFCVDATASNAVWNEAGGGGASPYTSDGTYGSGRVATLTDTLRFKDGTFEIQGAGTSTGTTLALYDGDSTPNKTWEWLDNGDVHLGQATTIRADFTEPLKIESTANNPAFIINALTSGANTNIDFESVNSKKWLIGNLASDNSFRFYNYTSSSTALSLSSTGIVVGGNTTSESTSSNAAFIAKGDGSSQDGYIQLNCSQNSHGIKLKSPPHSAGASYTLTLPDDTGSNGQVLKTDGAGALSWGAAGGSSIFTADGTFGSGRTATLTDTLSIKDSGGTNDVFKLNTNGEIIIANGGSTYSKFFTNGDVALGGSTIIGVQAGITIHRNTLVKAEADTLANVAFQIVNTSNSGVLQVRGNGDCVIGGNSFVGSENISLQGSTFIKGEGTSTGITLALYDNDTTPAKTWEFLDDGSLTGLKSKTSLIAQNSTSNDLTEYVTRFRNSGDSSTYGIIANDGYFEFGIGNAISNTDFSTCFQLGHSNSINSTSSYFGLVGNSNTLTGTGNYRYVLGSGNSTSGGAEQVILGVDNTVSANYTSMIGSEGTLSGLYSSAIGRAHSITDQFSVGLGAWVESGASGASIIGHGVETDKAQKLVNSTANSLALGWNSTTPTYLFAATGATIKVNLDMDNNRITNAVVNPSVQEAANSATFTINADEETDGVLTAMSANTTIAAPTGTPVQSQSLIFRFKDDGSARTLTWNAIFRAIGVTLPTTTTASKLLYVGCKYNSTDTKWDVVSVQEEA